MPKTIAKLFFLCLALPAFAFAADCSAPEPPMNLPDGATATKEEMLNGQETVQAYMKEAKEYLDCIDTAEEKKMRQMADKGEAGRKKLEEEIVQGRKDRNAVVAQMQRTADNFNKEITEFQNRGSGDS